jgi:hypothetical protein
MDESKRFCGRSLCGEKKKYGNFSTNKLKVFFFWKLKKDEMRRESFSSTSKVNGKSHRKRRKSLITEKLRRTM